MRINWLNLLTMLNKYYVYVYLDPRKEGNFKYGEYDFNYEPFYVGKGYGNRLFEHLRPSRLNKVNGNIIKQNKINKLLNNGYKPIIIKICENLTEDVALELEIKLICLMGRINVRTGVLTNMTDGGDGTLGRNITDEFKEKQSNLMKTYYSENPIPNEVKDKISQSLLSKKMVRSKETRDKIGNANKGRKYSDEYITHLREIRKGVKLTHRNNYELISPDGKKYSVLGRSELEIFIRENNLSLRRLLTNINKGVITDNGRTINTKNCVGWIINEI